MFWNYNYNSIGIIFSRFKEIVEIHTDCQRAKTRKALDYETKKVCRGKIETKKEIDRYL